MHNVDVIDALCRKPDIMVRKGVNHMDQLGNELKKILMAGIGAVSVSVEKAQEIVNTLAQKGAITFEQAKTLSEEAAAKIKKAIDESEIKKALDHKPTQDSVIRDLKSLTADELACIKKSIEELESLNAEQPEEQD
jgi:polyhydroxyalkanoate synthesis regulator phasin